VRVANYQGTSNDRGKGEPVGGVVPWRGVLLVAESAKHFARVPGPWPGTY
jgi:hypothetical protein